MKKSEAIKEAALKLQGASDTAAAVASRLGGIRRQALSEGMTAGIIRQIRKANELAKELKDMAEVMDWDVDETDIITKEIKNNEEVN